MSRFTHLPQPIRPLNPDSTGTARTASRPGLAHRKALRVDDFVGVAGADQQAAEPAPAAAAPVWDWAAANQRKIDAVRQLAPLADALDDIESPDRRVGRKDQGTRAQLTSTHPEWTGDDMTTMLHRQRRPQRRLALYAVPYKAPHRRFSPGRSYGNDFVHSLDDRPTRTVGVPGEGLGIWDRVPDVRSGLTQGRVPLR